MADDNAGTSTEGDEKETTATHGDDNEADLLTDVSELLTNQNKGKYDKAKRKVKRYQRYFAEEGPDAKQEGQESRESLEYRKNRAQVIANTCMSIVHVSLLRLLLDKGPVGTKYYTALLVLVSATLCIQVFVGLISIYVTNLNSNKKKHKGSIWQNCCIHICHCKCKCSDSDSDTDSVDSDTDNEKQLPYPKRQKQSVNTDSESGYYKRPKGRRCCSCTTRTMAKHERAAMWLAKHYQRDLIRNEKVIRKLILNSDVSKDRLKSLKNKNEEIYNQREELAEHVQNIRESWTLRTVSFWQNTITYLLYIVFIMNAFIVGLEFGNLEKYDDSVTSSSPVAATSPEPAQVTT